MNPSLQGADPRIHFQGIHLHLTEALQATIYEKFGALLRHNERIMRMEVRLGTSQTLGKNNSHLFSATAIAKLRGPDIAVHEEGTDAYGVLEALASKVDRALEKRHGLRKEKRKHPHAAEVGANFPKTELEGGPEEA